jgi:predicted nucleotidyltransferase component of viral defense system
MPNDRTSFGILHFALGVDMVGFGELRRLSLQWQIEIAAVERVYALDWLLKGIFARKVLGQALALSGPAALGKAHFPDYPPIGDADLVRGGGLDDTLFESELSRAAEEAAQSSGLGFSLHSIRGTEARFEFTGPLGRRSAAQPLIPLRFHSTSLRAEAVLSQLLHPFADRCEATVRAVSLEELAARGIAMMAGMPRAYDVFDLWFIIRYGGEAPDYAKILALAHDFAREKGLVLRPEFEPAHRMVLARAWDRALRQIRDKPTFAQAEAEIQVKLEEIIG